MRDAAAVSETVLDASSGPTTTPSLSVKLPAVPVMVAVPAPTPVTSAVPSAFEETDAMLVSELDQLGTVVSVVAVLTVTPSARRPWKTAVSVEPTVSVPGADMMPPKATAAVVVREW